MLSQLSAGVLPGLIAITLVVALVRRVPVYDEFIAGANEGVKLGLRLVPLIIAIYVAIGIFRESGALVSLTEGLDGMLRAVGIPVDIVPLMVIRPFSHSAAMGIIVDILDTYGPDSFTGLLASVMHGSSETTFYVLTVYLGAVGIRRSLHAVPLLLFGDLVGYVAALWMVRLFFFGGG